MSISYKLMDKHVRLLKELQGKFEREFFYLESLSDEKINYIKKCSIVSNIGASTRIENAILTDVEIDWIDTEVNKNIQHDFAVKERFIKNKLSKDKERSIEEVAGYRQGLNIVFDMYNDFSFLRQSDVKDLHRELLKYFPKAGNYLGNYKKQVNSVVEINNLTKKTKIVLKTVDPGIETEIAMKDLFDWYNSTLKEEVWIIPVAVEFVFRFLAIHPFQDGNGRISRLLFQLILLCSDERCFEKVIPYVGLDRCLEQTRGVYYKVLRKCSNGKFKKNSKNYDYIPFLEYMINMLDKSMDNFYYYADKYEKYQKLSQTSLTILTCFKQEPECTLQTKDIIEKLDIPRRTIIYSLNVLLENGFIQKMGQGVSSRYKITF
jgi:Fic family protein